MPLEKLEARLAVFKASADTSVYALASEDRRQKEGPVTRKSGPDFTLLRLDSSTFSLSSIRGKYILLDF